MALASDILDIAGFQFQGFLVAFLRRRCHVISDLLSRGWYARKKQVIKE